MSSRISALSPYWIWALFSIPAVGMLIEALTSDNARIFHILVHPSGEFSARFMIIAMMATPLCMLLKSWRGPFFYILDKASVDRIIDELPRLYIWTGWVAFVIFIPLAVTSMDYFVRVMGPRWKTLQRWTYPAAVLTLVHWAAIHNWNSPAAAIVHFAPLAILETYRIWYWYIRPRKAAA